MKAFVLAAGLGTRLKPWTLEHPKALVSVGGIPMLERVITNITKQGFDTITINVHHFANQIVDFLNSRQWGAKIQISDESEKLLDTGGAILHAKRFLCADNEPFLVHNVDILSNALLGQLMHNHKNYRATATLLVSNRTSSRKLIFNTDKLLCGWHNLNNGEYKPQGFVLPHDYNELAFSGIHIMNPQAVEMMTRYGYEDKFSIIDFYLSACQTADVKGLEQHNLQLIDIGKPETLSLADDLMKTVNRL